MQDIQKYFQAEIDDLSLKLIATFGLVFEQPVNSAVPDPLSRWLDFRLRYIEPRPRQIVASSKFPVSLPPEITESLHALEKAIIDGDDINAFQSKTSVRNDTSGNKRQQRTDGLWATWGIHHLHLTSVPLKQGQSFSARSDWLLFLMVTPDVVAFIDVREHNEAHLWSQEDLVKTYIQSFPGHSKQFRMNGVLGLANSPPTAEETAQLRKAGVTSLIEVNGNVYAPPGGGVTTASTALKATQTGMVVRSNLKEIAKWVAEPDSPMQLKASELAIVEPYFDLIVFGDGNIGIGLRDTEWRWGLRRETPGREKDAMETFHETFLPKWAGKALVTYWASLPNQSP